MKPAGWKPPRGPIAVTSASLRHGSVGGLQVWGTVEWPLPMRPSAFRGCAAPPLTILLVLRGRLL